ncbi:MAG: hypothetical protein MZV64_67250 [Ignavibacteriales bacterium]|nr:hypothetical protein [Ignavibacteriales bacterium]
MDNYTSLNDGADPAYVNGSGAHFIQDDRGIGAMEFKINSDVRIIIIFIKLKTNPIS